MPLSEKRLRNKPLRLVYVEARSIRGNPRNWRTHPEEQRAAIAASIEGSGWAGALLYNETTDRLIDGHGRLEGVAPDAIVPVLVGRWTEKGERVVLAQLDTITNMAGTDSEALSSLLDDIDRSELDDNVADILDGLADISEPEPEGDDDNDRRTASSSDDTASDRFSVVAHCKDEDEQQQAYDLLRGAGIKCQTHSEFE